MRNKIGPMVVLISLAACGGGGGGGGEAANGATQGSPLTLSGRAVYFELVYEDLTNDWDGYEKYRQIVVCRVPELGISIEAFSRTAWDSNPYSYYPHDPDPVHVYPVTRGNRFFVQRRNLSLDTTTYDEYQYDPFGRAFFLSSSNATLPPEQPVPYGSYSDGKLFLTSENGMVTVDYTPVNTIEGVHLDRHNEVVLLQVTQKYGYSPEYGRELTTLSSEGYVDVLLGTADSNEFKKVFSGHAVAREMEVMIMP